MNSFSSPDAVDILNQLQACVFVTAPNLEILYCNTAAEELISLSSRQIIGMNLNEILLDGDLNPDTLCDVLESANVYFQKQARVLLNSREWVLADFEVTRHHTPDEEHYIIECHVTARQHYLNLESSEYSQHLAANALIRGLGHEIKNPLGGLRGAAQLLALELEQEHLQEYTNVIIKEADRLSALVDRMMAPNRTGDLSMTNLYEPLEKAVQLVEIEAEGNITIDRNYDPSIPEFMLFSDAIQQAFLNLLQNASQAIEGDGLIEIQTRVVRHMLLGDKQHPLVARIRIIDSGPGVPEHIVPRLFMPLVSGRANGTGLGLGVAQSIVQQHQGAIEYRQDKPRTTFSIYLPILFAENP